MKPKRPHPRLQTKVKGITLTEQSHKLDCDINHIMAKAKRGESSAYIRDDVGQYGDATSMDYYEAHQLIASANTQFEELPSQIRNRFKNDPAKLLEFIQNPANLEEAIELKLVKQPPPAPPEPPAPAEPSPTPAAPAAPQA